MRKRMVITLLLVILLIISITGCAARSALDSTVAGMSDALKSNEEQFYKTIDILLLFEEISIYKEQQDVVLGNNRYVAPIQELWITSDQQLSDDMYDLLYETMQPLFKAYNLYSIYCISGRVKFVFEQEYGQVAYLEWSKTGFTPVSGWTVLDSKQLDKEWFAVIYSD